MTVHRIKTCACGHSADFHEKDGKKHGRCTYGHDRTHYATSVAPCPCARFHRRASPAAYGEDDHIPPPSALLSREPEVLSAIDEIIRGFQRLRAALPIAKPVDARGSLFAPAASSAPARAEGRVVARDAKPANSGDWVPSGPATNVMRAMRMMHPNPTTNEQLGVLTGYPPHGSTIRGALAELRREGAAEDGQPLQLTAKGVATAGPVEPLPTGVALVDFWARELGGPAGSVLRAVFRAHPRELSAEDLEKELGYPADGSTLRGAFAALRKFALVEKKSRRLGPPMVEAHARGAR